MMDDLEQLERRLTRITAPGGPETNEAIATELDAEDTELRMGWLALGDLLRRADAIESMPTLRMPAAAMPMPIRSMPASRAATWRHLTMAATAAAIVASLMVALTLPVGQQSQLPNGAAIATSGSSVAPSGASVAVAPWKETIDDEIESAGAAVREAQNALAVASASDQIQYQIEMFRMELDSNPW